MRNIDHRLERPFNCHDAPPRSGKQLRDFACIGRLGVIGSTLPLQASRHRDVSDLNKDAHPGVGLLTPHKGSGFRDGSHGLYDCCEGLIAMRKHGQNGWQWTLSYKSDGSARYTVPRRATWDLRCEESRCTRVGGRKSARWTPRRRRWRAGGRPR